MTCSVIAIQLEVNTCQAFFYNSIIFKVLSPGSVGGIL